MPQDHQCPKRSCPVRVSNRLFACPTHWAALAGPAKTAIYDTAGMHLLQAPRLDAIRTAREEWGDLP